MENAQDGPAVRKITRQQQNTALMLLVGLSGIIVFGALAPFNPTVAVAGSCVIFLLALVESRPVLIVYGLAILLPLTGGMARGAAIPFLRVGQAVVVLGFVLFLLAKSGPLSKSWFTLIDLTFVLYVLSGAVFPVLVLYYRGGQIDLSSTDVNGSSPIQSLLGPFQYYLLYRIVVAIIHSEKQIRLLLKVMFVTSIIVSMIGILEELNVGPVKTFLANNYPIPQSAPGYNIVDLRVASTLQHYSGLGAYLTFSILLVLVCYFDAKRMEISQGLLASTVIIDSIALVLSGTFAAWIGLAVGALVIFFLQRRLPRSLVFALIGVTLAAILFQPFITDRLNYQLGGNAQGLVPESFGYRIILWQELALPAIGQHLFFGWGPTPQVNLGGPTGVEESEYFHLLLEGGICYLSGYLALFGTAIAVSIRRLKSKDRDASWTIAIGLLAILIAMSIMDISGEYFTYVGGTQTFWILLAVVVASQQPRISANLSGRWSNIDKWQGSQQSYLRSSWQTITGTITVGRSTGSTLLNMKDPLSSYSLIPDYADLSSGRFERFSQRFRFLDWHFVKDSILVGVGSILSRILGLVFSTLLAHFLVSDEFGFFRYAATLSGIFSIAAAASPVCVARFIAAYPHDQQSRDRYFTNGVVGVAVLTMISLLFPIPLLLWLHAFKSGVMFYMVGTIGFFGYFAIVRGLGDAWKMSLSYLLSNIALVAALFIVIDFFKLHTANVALTIYGLTNLLPFLLEFIRPMRLHFRLRLVSRKALMELGRFAVPIVIASGVYTLWSGIDVVLLENFDPHATGSYAAAKTLAQGFAFLPTTITMVLMPRVASQETGKSRRYLVWTIAISLLVSLTGLISLVVLGPGMITFLFGHRYSDAYLSLVVLSIGSAIYSIYIILEGFVIGRGLPNMPVKALMTALISTCITGFWLIPRLGALGAALAFTIGSVLCSLVLLGNTWSFLRKERPVASNQAPTIREQVRVTISRDKTLKEQSSQEVNSDET